jgi:hypothetical protein
MHCLGLHKHYLYFSFVVDGIRIPSFLAWTHPLSFACLGWDSELYIFRSIVKPQIYFSIYAS